MRDANFYDKETNYGLYKIRTYTQRLKEKIEKDGKIEDMRRIFLGIRENRFCFYYYGYVLLNITMRNDKLVIMTRDEFGSDVETNKTYAEVMKKIPLVSKYEKDKTMAAHKVGKHYEIYESDYTQPGVEKETYSVKELMTYLLTNLMAIMEQHFGFKENSERAIQNRYMTEYTPKDEIYVIDMEFLLPGYMQKKIKEAIHGRYDMIALKHLNDDNYKLVFIELKSKKGACKGTSGINDHIKDMRDFLKTYENNSDLKTEFKSFVNETLKTRSQLKLIPNKEYNIDFDNPEFWLLFDMIDNTDCSSIDKIEKLLGSDKEKLIDKNEEYLKIYNGNILNGKKNLKMIEK